MQPSITTLKPDDLFDQKTKELFLQIPHKIVPLNEKMEMIDFNVKENGRFPLLRNSKMIRVKESLTKENEMDFEVMKHLYNSNYSMTPGERLGLFITANHGAETQNFIKELYKHDKKSGEWLLDSYMHYTISCEDITSVEEKLMKQLEQLKEYLIREKLEVTDYKIDYEAYLKKDQQQRDKFVEQLYEQHGSGEKFPAYNDLDYTPFISGGNIFIYDSSSTNLFVVKMSNEKSSIYKITRDFTKTIFSELEDDLNEFVYEHNQFYLLLAKFITEADLIGEIENGKLTRASYDLTSFEMVQSCIVNQLYEEGKIKNILPKLTFEELLDNYTLQKEYYHMKERALLKIFKDLKLHGDTLTYENFSVVKETKNLKIKHEDMSIHELKNLKERLEQNHNLPIKELPPEYKEQINQYLNQLVSLYDNENTHEIAKLIKEEMNNSKPKLKIK